MTGAADKRGLLARLDVRSVDPAVFCRDEAERLRVLAEYFIDGEVQQALTEAAERLEAIAAARQNTTSGP